MRNDMAKYGLSDAQEKNLNCWLKVTVQSSAGSRQDCS